MTRSLFVLLLFVGSGWAATLQVGPTRTYKTPCAAISVAVAGDSVEIDGPATFSGANAPCRIVVPMKITGVGGQVTLNARDAANVAWNVYSHGIWSVQTTGLVEIENVDFVGAAIATADGNNGAGIRLVGGNLNCTNCGLFYNQDGILTNADPTMTIRLIRCHFAFNGAGDGQSHNIYVGRNKELYVERSVFRNANAGQALKSRADKTSVLYSLLGESAAATGGNSNVELDIPNGGVVSIIGNLILQNPSTTNGYMVTIGVEGADKAVNSIAMLHNTVVGYRTTNYFLRFTSSSSTTAPFTFPGPVSVFNNLFAGPGAVYSYSALPTAAATGGNSVFTTVAAALFSGAADYRLASTSPAATAAVALTGTGFDTSMIASQPLIPFAVEPRTDWTAAGAFALNSSAPMTAPALSYPMPVVPTVFSKVGATTPPTPVPTTTTATVTGILVVRLADGTTQVVTVK